MSMFIGQILIEDRIHFVLSYKIIVRRFIKVFKQKALKSKQFQQSFKLEKDFHLVPIKEEMA